MADKIIYVDKATGEVVNQQTKRSGCDLICKSGQTVTTKSGKTIEGLFMTVWKIHGGRTFEKDGVKKKVGGVLWKGRIFRSEEQKKRDATISNADNGNQSREWIGVTLVMSSPMHNDIVQTGMMDLSTYKVYFKNWNMIANPHANNGGYFGKHISKEKK